MFKTYFMLKGVLGHHRFEAMNGIEIGWSSQNYNSFYYVTIRHSRELSNVCCWIFASYKEHCNWNIYLFSNSAAFESWFSSNIFLAFLNFFVSVCICVFSAFDFPFLFAILVFYFLFTYVLGKERFCTLKAKPLGSNLMKRFFFFF